MLPGDVRMTVRGRVEESHAAGRVGRAEVGVIAVPSGMRVLIATRPVDFRKGMDGLAAVVKEHLRVDPFSGAIFVFRAKRADRVKLIMWDGTGLCLFAKRLEQGTFRWPKIEDGTMRLTPRSWPR